MVGISLQTVAGLVGATLTVVAYLLLQLGKLRGQGYAYAGMNAAGAAFVLLSLTEAFNLSSAIMQMIWISVSVIGIVRYAILHRRSRVTPEEQAFLEATVPGLGRIEARRLLDLADWRDGVPGTRLTEQGASNAHLHYLVDGVAEVHADGISIGRISANQFVGDMSLVTGREATATVELTEAARYVAFPVVALGRLLERDHEVRRHFKAAVSNHLVGKLVQTSRELAASRQPVAAT